MDLTKKTKQLFEDSEMNLREFATEYKVNYSTLSHIINGHNLAGYKFFQELITNMGYELQIIEL